MVASERIPELVRVQVPEHESDIANAAFLLREQSASLAHDGVRPQLREGSSRCLLEQMNEPAWAEMRGLSRPCRSEFHATFAFKHRERVTNSRAIRAAASTRADAWAATPPESGGLADEAIRDLCPSMGIDGEQIGASIAHPSRCWVTDT